MEIKKNLSTIIFWGACWGIIEATLGNLLHVINLNIGWLFWFPIAFFFMYKVYKQTGKQEAILILCVMSAGIKLLDLFMPVRIDIVVNPAAAIILEGLAVYMVIQVLNKSGELFRPKLLNLAAVSFSWKIFFTLYVLFLPNWMLIVSPVRELIPYLKFLLMEGTVNFITIFIVIKLWEKAKNIVPNNAITKKLEKVKEMVLKPKLLLSIVMLIAGVSLQLTY